MAKSSAPQARGSRFYKNKGLRPLVVRAPKAIRKRLKLLAVKLQKPVQETVQLVLDDFRGSPSKYKLNGINGKSTDSVEITVFVSPDAHQELKLEGVRREAAMKDLAGAVVNQYLTQHCKIRIDDES